MKTTLPLLGLTLGLAACGDSTETVTDTVATLPDTLFGEIDFEVDTTSSITVPPDFGDACSENTDCVSGYCIQGPSGSVCSKTCIELCPEGWDCRGVQMGGSDIVLVCVPTGAVDTDTVGGDTTTTTPTDASTTTTPDTVTTTDTGGGDSTVDATTTTDVGPGDTTVADTSEPPLTGNACLHDLGPSGDNLYDESSASGGPDFPDCVTGCDAAAQTGLWEIDLRNSPFTGALGGLDAEVHIHEIGNGPDIDIVAIRADPRTMIEFAVQKDSSSGLMDPVVYVSDGFQVRTYNSDVSPTNLCARTTIAYPYVGPLPIFVAIEDAKNYDAYTPDGYLPGTVGGPSYGYTLRIRTGGFAPFEMGNLQAASTTNLTGHELVLGGETRYYRFWAPGTVKPVVTITRAAGASTSFIPAVAGMKTIAGELVWQRADFDSDGNGSVVMQANNAFRPCVPPSECPAGFSCPGPVCTAANAEFVFAVFDWNGAADPGAFTYDVKVQLQ